MEPTIAVRSINPHSKFAFAYLEKLSKDDTLIILKDLERLGCL